MGYLEALAGQWHLLLQLVPEQTDPSVLWDQSGRVHQNQIHRLRQDP